MTFQDFSRGAALSVVAGLLIVVPADARADGTSTSSRPFQVAQAGGTEADAQRIRFHLDSTSFPNNINNEIVISEGAFR